MGRRHVGRPSRSCSTRNWPPTTRPDWCWRSSGSTTPPRRCWWPAPTSSAAATCRRSSTARSGCRGSPSPRPGSDLAGLRTTARRDGDYFVVNGQKLWASGGMHADWCLLLARTDPDAPKRHGISYFLMDMTTPGHRRPADPQRHRRLALLRDLPQRRADPRRQPGRRGERGLAGGPGDARRRAGDDDAGTGRAARQRGLPLAGAGLQEPGRTAATDRRRRGRRPAGAVRDRDHRAARAVPRRRGRGQRGRHRGPGRRLDRQAVLQRTAAADDRFRRRDRRAGRADRS